jgi:hypothetical protein
MRRNAQTTPCLLKERYRPKLMDGPCSRRVGLVISNIGPRTSRIFADGSISMSQCQLGPAR